MERKFRTAFLLLFTLGTAGVPSGVLAGGNLLLITLDTTRADHLSCYGYSKPTTPRIDSLAREGVLLESVTTQIPLTGPAHVSLMTSRHPRAHRAIRNGVPMSAEIPTLAEVLKARGAATAAFLSGWTLRKSLTGLQRGFDRYDDDLRDRYRVVNSQRFADQVTPLATAWLREHARGDFFLWVHFFDPHAPYRKHKDFLHLDPLSASPRSSRIHRPLEKIARYDSELSFVDHHVGILLQELEDLGLKDSTLVILTADHGESLGEHGYFGHGRRLYEASLRIPLILRYPGRLPAGVRSSFPAQTIDVMPTALTLLGVPHPKGLEGRDLLPFLSDDPPEQEPEIFFETFEGARKRFWRIFAPRLKGVPLRVGKRVGHWKYIYTPKEKRHELYDLSRDPGETRNRIQDHPEFRSLARQCIERLPAPALTAKEGLGREDEKKLRSLGYIP